MQSPGQRTRNGSPGIVSPGACIIAIRVNKVLPVNFNGRLFVQAPRARALPVLNRPVSREYINPLLDTWSRVSRAKLCFTCPPSIEDHEGTIRSPAREQQGAARRHEARRVGKINKRAL